MRYIYLCLTACLLLFASCYGDKGNYDYTEVNKVMISGIPDTINRIAFVDGLEIRPQIKSTLYDDKLDNYKYRWTFIPSGADKIYDGEVDYTVSEEKDLILPVVTMGAGKYNCFYTVRDTVNGIEWRHKFNVQIQIFTSEGWLVLCDDEGRGRLDIIVNTYDSDAKEYVDIIGRDMWQDNDFVTHNPQRIIYNFWRSGHDQVMYVCDEGTFNINNDELEVTEGGNLRWYFGGAPPEKIHVRASQRGQMSGQSNWILIDGDDNAYMMNAGESGSLFLNPINYINGTERFTPAPFVGTKPIMTNWTNTAPSMLMYDATNRRFVEVKAGARYPSVMVFDSQPYFTAQTGYDMVHLESSVHDINQAILRDPLTGRYYYYAIRLEKDGKNVQVRHGEVKGPKLDKAKFFTFQQREAQPYLFYATEDDEIYVFLMGDNSSEAHKVLSFQGETIAAMKFTAFMATGAFAAWEKERNYQLMVATNKTDGPQDQCGIVRMYETPAPFGTPLVKVKEHAGLGRIVDVTYKERQR